jgi:hypothetical protein
MLRFGGYVVFLLFAVTFFVAGQMHCSCVVEVARALSNTLHLYY